MIDLLSCVLLASILLILHYFLRNRRKCLKTPTPPGLPFFGNVFQIDPKRADLTLCKWAEQYGDVFKFKVFGQEILVVNSMEAIREVLVKRGRAFAGRPRFYRAKVFSGNFCSLGFGHPSATWNKLRTTTITVLKMYDSGMQRLENITGNILEDLVDEIRVYQGEAFDPKDHLHSAILNIIYLLMIGEKFTSEDDEFYLMSKAEKLSVKILSADTDGAKLDQFPWLRHFGNGAAKALKEYEEVSKELISTLRKKVMRDLDDGKVKDAVLYGLYKAVREGRLQDEHVRLTSMDLILGGVNTTLANLHAWLNVLLHNRGVLDKLRTEVINVVGQVNPVNLKDRHKMPYTRATIYELLRYTTVGSLGFPHVSLEDTEVGGYMVPKDTQVFTNLFYLHHNEHHWPKPFDFRPERFLDNSGQVLPADHPIRRRLLPFGAGTRGCIGETMALSRAFLILTTLVQKFDFQPEGDAPMVPCDPRTYDMALALQHKTYFMRMLPRMPLQQSPHR